MNSLIGQFVKYHGNANDFIIIDHSEKILDLAKLVSLAPFLCDRNRGIGADGILSLSVTPDNLQMVVINSDGSIAQNCGNGLRCAARWYFDKHKKKSLVNISLGSKNYACVLEGENISVQMGECLVERLENKFFSKNNLEAQCFKVNLANDHLVFVFSKDLDFNMKLVREVQKDFVSACEYNLGFIKPRLEGFYSRVFERGVGFTKSCGSGACAAAAALAALAALSLGLKPREAHNLLLWQPGGPIWVDAHVLENMGSHARLLLKQTGPAQAIFSGVL